VPWYYRVRLAINAAAPFLVPTQQTNLALLVSAIRKQPEKPWYLATSLKDAKMSASWYWQRGWIEQSFKDSKSLFGVGRVRVGCPKRLSRLAMALTLCGG
jgi:hypothetical protein